MALEFTFAYQPIVNVEKHETHSFEALVRGPNNEPANWVLKQHNAAQLRAFDADARLRAIKLSAQLGLSSRINLNVLPEAMADFEDGSSMEALQAMVEMAVQYGLKPDQLVLEVSESETIKDFDCFVEHANQCRRLGVKFAIDDFGSGYSGLNLLAEFQPEAVKLDMLLVRDIEHRGPRQAIVRGVLRTCEDLGIDIVAEGVETAAEYEWLRNEGIVLFQGYLFARPAFEALPAVIYPN
ncbi:EAL domain-containing protein [Nitrosomonas sp. Is35]|uniref:EAL domain-containing protein n=1 Tax=unclassified Nitrosomonas TaxID=2609265 RepID=UPI00294AD319|nr:MULTISPECIES: EAL domain-containing protein [unclassified Nitrosomonas]MDV6342450.1 EAL domain-containing protein [Nitrosomonas sp. Is24]MDV6348354.1 EAL domain-containing protein [Nitrosomonas sp. Is35]